MTINAHLTTLQIGNIDKLGIQNNDYAKYISNNFLHQPNMTQGHSKDIEVPNLNNTPKILKNPKKITKLNTQKDIQEDKNSNDKTNTKKILTKVVKKQSTKNESVISSSMMN